MSFEYSCIKKFSLPNFRYEYVQFVYPKIILFEDAFTVCILDLHRTNKSQIIEENIHKLESGMLETIILEDYLFILLENSNITVIDVYKHLMVTLQFNEFQPTIHLLRSFEKELYLIAENGDCFILPYKFMDLSNLMTEEPSKINISLIKSSTKPVQTLKKSLALVNGLCIYLEDGKLNLKCTVTKLRETLLSDFKIEKFMCWKNWIVLSNNSNMWIIDLKEPKSTFEFGISKCKYIPVATYLDCFYYILSDASEVQICCAWNCSSYQDQNEDLDISLNNITSKLLCQETLKSQLQNLIKDVESIDPVEVIPQIKLLYEKIDDLPFLVCISLKLCKINLVFKSLLYLLYKRLNSDECDLISNFNDAVAKVELVEYINFRGKESYENENLFDMNFVQLCSIFLMKSDLDLASICWLKYAGVVSKINSDDIELILNAIPCNVKLGALIIWLKNVVPSLLEENPFHVDLFVKWTTDRVFLLEQSTFWPKLGVKFLNEMIKVLESSLKTIVIRPISVDDLDKLKSKIETIIVLKDNYKINIFLSELSSQSPSEVALIMLRRCYTEDLGQFLQDYLTLYSMKYSFDLDEVLQSYIESEAASSGGGVDSTRLNLLLNVFNSTTNRLDCLLNVLKGLDVPWNQNVLEIAVKTAAWALRDFTITDADRVIANEIHKEINYSRLKVILKKYNFPITCSDYTLVLHRIVNTLVIDLSDLKNLTSIMCTYVNYGSILYIDRCLRDCETNLALNYFQSLPDKEKKVMNKTVIAKYEEILNSNCSDIIVGKNYLDFIKGMQMLSVTEITTLENLYHLKNSYKMQLTVNELYREASMKEVSSSLVLNGSMASCGRGGSIARLTRCFPSQDTMLIELLRRTCANREVRFVIESLIISYMKSNVDGLLCQFVDGNNTKLLVNSWKVLLELVANCEEEYLHYLTNLLSILNSLVCTNIVMKNLSIVWKFHYIFIPIPSFSSINDLINFYNLYLTNSEHYMFNSIVDKNDLMPFRKFSNIASNVNNRHYDINEEFYVIRENVSKRILSKCLTAQSLDELLLIISMLLLNNHEIEDKHYVLDLLRGQNESLPHYLTEYLTTPIMRRTFALDSILPSNSCSHPPQYILKTKFNLSLNEIALPDNTEETWDVKVVLFYVLKQYPETTFERLVDLCRALNISVNHGLSVQLISLLSSWKLKYKIEVNDLGYREIICENNEKQLLSQCIILYHSITNKDLLRDVLNDFWKNGETTLDGRPVSVNPYFYEVYLCIYFLLFGSSVDIKNVKEYYLLNFLKNYKRKSAPKQYEFELFSVKGMFPEIGHYRLPFHLFMSENMWSNLKSEITLETYERWLPAASLLSLNADIQTSRDMICSNALKQTMTSRKQCDPGDEVLVKESEPWRLTTREEPLLRAAHKCVRYIANMEWAGACLFYVLQGCARGADQVAAAQLCYQFAQRWADLQPGNRAIRQMERWHYTLSTRHALQKIEWSCEEFIRLLAEPIQLIRVMYMHPDFIKKINEQDVNRAVNEIADKNGINISTIRIQILESILEKSNGDNKSFVGLTLKELQTARYILKATCPKMGAIYLSRIAFDDETDFNKSKKLRALQCLMSVVDPDTALKVTNRERDDLWSSLLEILYTVSIENIDMPWIVSTFAQDKKRALQQLVQGVSGNVEGLKIAAALTFRFGDLKLIRELIIPLLRAGLYDELVPLLLKCSAHLDEIVCGAWRSVIISPFQKADYPITDRQRSKCLNALNLLPVCPIIKDEDLVEIWNHCVRCKCFGIGCLVLPYMTPETRKTLSEINKIDRRNLIASLKNLQVETYLVSGAMHVIESMASRNYK